MKHKFLSRKLRSSELVFIDVDKWKNLSEPDQYNFLY
jgi:hypothetical protein